MWGWGRGGDGGCGGGGDLGTLLQQNLLCISQNINKLPVQCSLLSFFLDDNVNTLIIQELTF